MNEITKIHLGRQAFTIAVDAHKVLQEYLHAIQKRLGEKGKEVTKEVELRMAELLAERGVTGDKVVLLEDVEYLKEQLGSPKDFAEDDAPSEEEKEPEKPGDEQTSKRLFRDTKHGMIAGVAAGLATFLKVDPILVRLAFIVLTLFWGWGILLYLVLWLIVPEAKSSSNRLQMQGKPVTVKSLKEVVDRADVPGATRRTGRTLGRFIEYIGVSILSLIGFAFIAAGVAAILGAMTASVYWLLNGGQVNGAIVFPVGAAEAWLLFCGIVAAVVVSLFMIFAGIAMVWRKWPVPGWVTGILVGIFLLAGSVGTALGFHVAPDIEKRTDALRKTQTVTVPEFNNVAFKGHDTQFTYVPSDNYSVKLSYVSGKNKSNHMVTSVKDDKLTVDVTAFAKEEDCRFICFYNHHMVEVTIYAPSLDMVSLEGADSSFESFEVLRQKDMALRIDTNSYVNIGYVYPESVIVDETKSSGFHDIQLKGIRAGEFRDQAIQVSDDAVYINRSDTVELLTRRTCEQSEPLVYVAYNPKPLTDLKINSVGGLHAPGVLESRQLEDGMNAFNCVMVDRVR